MEASLRTDCAQIFSRCPKKSELPKIWGGGGGGCSPPRPPGPYAYDSDMISRFGRPVSVLSLITNHTLDQTTFTKTTVP